MRRFRLRAGVSQNALAKIVGINASYINRLENGEREAPTRDVAQALAQALRLSAEEVDRLLFSAGHVPPSLQKLGPADSTIGAVTRLLTNDRLSPEARADFRAIVETMAIRWQDVLNARVGIDDVMQRAADRAKALRVVGAVQ
ncbi:MAG TPA: hypothetical protein DCR15_11280 [Arthrobacter bacterium]|nr:hypothetical protein [Arthrobacter sp.]